MIEKIKILLVEDDPNIVLRIEAIIYHMGYKLVSSIDNSEDALEFIQQSPPDILLMDIDIKGKLNGIEVVKKIRSFSIPVIFITGFTDGEYYKLARKTLPVAYLVKPFNELTLQAALENAVWQLSRSFSADKGQKEWEEDVMLNESFFIKRNNLLQKVKIEDIHYIHSEGNYCEIYSTKKFAIKMSLSKMLKRLPSKQFVRIHQRYIVQAELIDNIDVVANLIYIQGQKLPLVPKFKEDIMKLLQRL